MLTLLDTKSGQCTAASVGEPDREAAIEKSLQGSRQCSWDWWREIAIHCDRTRRDFLCCFLGILISFTTNGFLLEKVTSHRHIGEFSLTFMLCGLNALFALGIHRFLKEKRVCAPHKQIFVLGFFAFGSTVSSVIALRYMNFITRILGKSCKAILIMVVGRCFGKMYRPEKYLSICILCIGVAIFLIGTGHPRISVTETQKSSSSQSNRSDPRNLLFGMITLLVSLGCDGVTGAMEDRFFSNFQIGAFHLMFFVNIWKCCFAAIGVILTGEFARVREPVESSVNTLLLLSASGALGQVFVFLTLSKFGALTTSIFGTCRKVVSVIVSVVYFGHILSQKQVAGLLIVFSGIGINWIPFRTYFRAFNSRWCAFESPADDIMCIEESIGLLGELKETLIIDGMENTSPSIDP